MDIDITVCSKVGAPFQLCFNYQALHVVIHLIIVMVECSVLFNIITPHAHRERGKVISVGVHILKKICLAID